LSLEQLPLRDQLLLLDLRKLQLGSHQLLHR
jgi:hypothetical protein